MRTSPYTPLTPAETIALGSPSVLGLLVDLGTRTARRVLYPRA